MRIDVVTIFPDFLRPLELALVGRAREAGLLEVGVHDLRDWTDDRHRTVDDTPAGGGAGMVMLPEPWARALTDVVAGGGAPVDAPDSDDRPLLVVPTPAGELFDQRHAERWARRGRLVFACGRYEGIDQRVLDYAREDLPVDVTECSIGDYVLAGGESAALVMIEAVTRLVPGVLGNPASLAEESHGEGEAGLLEYPAYTKPQVWRDRPVPEVLLSGHHAAIARWRRDEALRRTALRRPDLLAALPAAALDDRDRRVLAELGVDPDA